MSKSYRLANFLRQIAKFDLAVNEGFISYFKLKNLSLEICSLVLTVTQNLDWVLVNVRFSASERNVFLLNIYFQDCFH